MKLPLEIESDWNRDVINDRLVEEHQSGNFSYDFAQWCGNNKRKYGWVQAYYYE